VSSRDHAVMITVVTACCRAAGGCPVGLAPAVLKDPPAPPGPGWIFDAGGHEPYVARPATMLYVTLVITA
jgi:hypothetical protein